MTESTRTRTRRVPHLVILGAAMVGLTASGLAAAGSAGAAPATARCGTADLSAQLKPGSPGAGQRYATVVLTNTSGHSCTVRGYGGLALLGAPGQGVPTDLRRVPSPAPQTVSLAPGGSARSLLPWTSGPVCQHGLIQQNAYVPGSAAF
jgi:hypothetical protein